MDSLSPVPSFDSMCGANHASCVVDTSRDGGGCSRHVNRSVGELRQTGGSKGEQHSRQQTPVHQNPPAGAWRRLDYGLTCLVAGLEWPTVAALGSWPDRTPRRRSMVKLGNPFTKTEDVAVGIFDVKIEACPGLFFQRFQYLSSAGQ